MMASSSQRTGVVLPQPRKGSNTPGPPHPGSGASRVDEPFLISVSRAVEMSGIGRSTIYKLISVHAFETRKIGKRRLISYPSLRSFLLG